MRLKRLWIDGFKNLNDFELDFTDKDGVTVLIGNNGSGKSNVLEAVSAIFSDLYNIQNSRRKKVEFSYKIEYTFNDSRIVINVVYEDDNIDYYFAKYEKEKFDKINNAQLTNYLPSNVLMVYSGEDVRIMKQYYEPFRKKFQQAIREAQTIPDLPKMLYLNSFFWTISLLSLLKSELPNNQEFCKKILKNNSLENIEILFEFNKSLMQYDISFLNQFSDGEDSKTITLDKFKSFEYLPNEKELFVHLTGMVGQRNKIKKLQILSNGIDTIYLSEGEKKQILIRAALEILADENALVLMDEPDANIHVANKEQIKTMLEEYPNRENILTTHSPTLMNKFEHHLVYLEEGKVKGYEKAEILREISGDIMSLEEQQIILNTTNDILLVEGKTDIIYIKTALEKLSDEYADLNFEYIPFGGTDNLQHFIEKFKPKLNQTIIAILDRDDAGKKALKQVFGAETDIDSFSDERKENMFIVVYPKTDGYGRNNFLVEDYFNKQIVKDMAKHIIDDYNDSFKSYPNISKQIKKDLPEKCQEFEKEKFNGFKKLFDLIKEIKDLP